MSLQNAIRRLVHYDPLTGVFTVRGRILRSDRVKLLGTTYEKSHVAYIYMTGEKPLGIVDHIDGNHDNNRWENLRLASPAENAWNSTLQPKLDQLHDGAWRGRVKAFGKVHYTEGFYDKNCAKEAAEQLRKKLHGEFAYHEGR